VRKSLLVFHCNYVSRAVYEIFSVKKWRDLEISVSGRLMSLKIAPFDRLYTLSFWSAIVSIALSYIIFSARCLHKRCLCHRAVSVCLSVRLSCCLSRSVFKVENQRWGNCTSALGLQTDDGFSPLFKVWERWISIIGGAGTALPCVQWHFNHWSRSCIVSKWAIISSKFFHHRV